jgi:hypothetical protein
VETPAHWIDHPTPQPNGAPLPGRTLLDWMAVALTIPAVLIVVSLIVGYVMWMLDGPHDLSCMLDGCDR